MSTSFLARCGGIRFDTHIKVQGAGVNQPWSGNRSGNIGLAYLCLFYAI